MKKYFDIVFDGFLKEQQLDKISSINCWYVVKSIKKKEDLISSNLPSIKPELKKLYFLEDLSFATQIKNGLIVARGRTADEVSRILASKQIDILANPISSDKPIFDEECARVASEGKKIIAFDMNEFRRQPYKAIKQAKFIITLLKKHRVDMIFCSFADGLSKLVDLQIRKSFAKELGLEESIIERIFDEGILCQKKE